MQLEPHRDELLRLRRAGESVAVLCTGLRGLGVEISDEALRQWLNRQLRRKTAKRERATRAIAPQEPMPASPQSEPKAVVPNVATTSGDAAAAVVTPTAVPIEAAPASPAPVAVVSAAPAVSPSVPSPQSGAGPVSAESAKPYTPWRNNFTPLRIVSRPRDP
jgi:hypothetical protein